MNIEPIDTSTTAGKIRVMQLAAEGRKVVWRPISGGSKHGWDEADDPAWDWYRDEYAILREPRECFVVLDEDGVFVAHFRDKTLAEQQVEKNRRWAAIHFREVIENG